MNFRAFGASFHVMALCQNTIRMVAIHSLFTQSIGKSTKIRLWIKFNSLKVLGKRIEEEAIHNLASIGNY